MSCGINPYGAMVWRAVTGLVQHRHSDVGLVEGVQVARCRGRQSLPRGASSEEAGDLQLMQLI